MDSTYIELSIAQVALAATLVVINGAISIALRLQLERALFWASVRTVVQLLLIGLVLRQVFAWSTWYIVFGLLAIMTTIAGVAAVRRARHVYRGIYLDSIVSIWASSWFVTAFGVGVVLQRVERWYEPQYTVPLLGMILGNSLNGVSLGLDRLGDELAGRRERVDAWLALGATRWEAARGAIQQALRTGMTPMINSMSVVGIVSLPGMMTGQLLSGVDPWQAVRYQIVIMFMIAAGTALGTVGVVLLSYRRLFNARHQFLYDRLTTRDS